MTQHRLIDHDSAEDVDYDEVESHQRWTLALDSDGDLRFSDQTNSLLTTHGTEAAKQSLKVALGTVKGEDIYDEDFGLDVFRATRNHIMLEREMRKALIYDDHRHDRVEQVEGVDIYDRGNRRAHVDVEVRLDTGDINTLSFDLGAL